MHAQWSVKACLWMLKRMSSKISPVTLAQMIADDFYQNRLNHGSRGMPAVKPWLLIPEVGAAQCVRDAGASEQEVRRFLTFVCAMDYQIFSDRLWKAAAELYPGRPELFDPAAVAAMRPQLLHRALRDASVAGRFHQKNAKSWRRIAERLVSSERSAVRRAIDEGIGCVNALRRDLKHFPLLRGKKIGPVWIRIMANPGGASIAPADAMSIGVDIHVRRLTRNLGLLDDGQVVAAIDTDDDSRDAEVRQIWRDAAIRADIQDLPRVGSGAGALDPALWFFGRHGCGHCETMARPVRFGRACEGCRLEGALVETDPTGPDGSPGR